MQGYWNNPEATAASFVEIEGKRFLRTGDLAFVDADGYFFMTDRLKRMINASGYKVWPAEVEALMYRHPAIQEACVIAAADARRGETVKALVVLKPGHVLSEQQIIDWAHGHMAAYKSPRIVQIVPSLPKSGSGKVMWRELQEHEKAAHGQAFPSKPITLIVPWPAGGSTDRHLRGAGRDRRQAPGPEHHRREQAGRRRHARPGHDGAERQARRLHDRAVPDGHAAHPAHAEGAWHPINDFSFIIGVSGYTFGFVVRADSPYKTFNDYIEAARKSPGKIDYGSTGTGTSPHLLMEEVSDNAKVQLNHVPFKGNADLMQALLGGHVMAASDATGWDKFVDGGQMRLLVTFGEKRTKRWPNVPTAKELGYNVVSNSPYGLVGPKGMDPAVVKPCTTPSRRRWTTQAPGGARPAEPGPLVPQRRGLPPSGRSRPSARTRR
jgi:tripartite-type tricarboxylate transporter receptor subunit TctC